MMGEYGYTNAATSLYGGQRPTFNEDGTGMPYNALLNMVGSSVLNQDISYDTSSKDPSMVRARVFIGNLIKAGITRDDLIDLCKPYGRLLAVTFFKGYAFVQFSSGSEADDACTNLNGKRWKGTIIDVHLAMTGPAMRKKPSASEDLSRKRRYDDVYTREDSPNVLDETAEQNKRNRDFAVGDKTANDDLADSAMADTLICGSCRFVTCDYEIFKDHRIAGCKNIKAENEPKSMRCGSCSQRFMSAWALMCHLTDFHRMQLYRDPDTSHTDEEEVVPAKRAPSPIIYKSMENGQPLTANDVLNAAPQAPIGTGSGTATPNTEVSGTPTKNTVDPPVQSPQWNPMTGQTIPGIQGLVDEPEESVDPQPIPTLGDVYGMR